MKNLILHKFEGHNIRIVDHEGNPWIVGADVCEVLGIKNPRDALSRLPEDEKAVVITDKTPITNSLGGRPQQISIINEPGLYRLIVTSRKPDAERFKRWIFHEVLPSIRETGKYEVPTQRKLYQHTLRGNQIQNSKDVNAHNYQSGGKLQTRNYNLESCVYQSGRTPKEWIRIAKNLGLKSKEYKSGKEVLRKLHPKIACSMSLSDDMVSHLNLSREKAFPIGKKSQELFSMMIEAGIEPAELE